MQSRSQAGGLVLSIKEREDMTVITLFQDQIFMIFDSN